MFCFLKFYLFIIFWEKFCLLMHGIWTDLLVLILYMSKWEHCLLGHIVSEMNLMIIVGATANIYWVLITFGNEQNSFNMTSFNSINRLWDRGYCYQHFIDEGNLGSKTRNWASLVAQWLRICQPMQGTRVRALVWEDPTCRGATRPVSHNYWACASGACAPQQERPR